MDRCIAIGTLTLPFILINLTLARAVAAAPDAAPFFDLDYFGVFSWVHLGFAFAWAGVLGWLFRIRGSEPEHPWAPHVTIQLSAAFATYFIHAAGTLTTPSSLYLIGAAVGGTLLFPWRHVALGMVTVLGGLAATTWAESRGLLPYGPILAGSPVADGHLAPWWRSRVGPYTLFFVGNTLVLFFFVVQRWRAREESLAGAYEALAAAHGELQRTDAERRQLAKAVETMRLGVTISSPEGEILYANPAGARMHGYEVAELRGQPVADLVDGGVPSPLSETGGEALAARGSWKGESVHVRRDGVPFPVQVVSDLVGGGPDREDPPAGDAAGTEGGDGAAVVTVAEDITERKQMEAALRQSEERYALVIRGTNDGLWDWDLRSNRIYLSPRWKAMLGHDDDDLGTDPMEWFERVHPEDRIAVAEALEAHVEGTTSHLEVEHRLAHADGSYRWVLARGIAVGDAAGDVHRVVGSQTDVTERNVHDPLTGLPNEVLFRDRVSHAVQRAPRHGPGGYAVVIADLDAFKNVNASLGHGAGDQLLAAVGERLAGSVDPGDTVARIGGDEFAVLLEDLTDVEAARAKALALQRALERPFLLGDSEVFTGASVGISFGSGPDDRPGEMLRNAETALHRAKAVGKGSCQVYEPGMRELAVERHRLETDLRAGVEAGAMVVHYQPIVRLDDRSIAGFEALVRWRHPERGLLSPASFVRLAEETGLIVEIGARVLAEACRQMAAWGRDHPADPPRWVGVNLSARQLARRTLLADVRGTLADTGLAPGALKLEVSESVVMEDAEATVRTFEALRRLDVRLTIDDFGTGYSSLSHLQRLPVDGLKIDRAFVTGLEVDRSKLEIVRTVIRLAESLGMDTVAEGVENAAQVELLADLGCSYAQGHHLAEPMPAEQVTEWLARGRV